jgi:deoxyribonuclease-4
MPEGNPRFGAHMSVAGGLPRAVERAQVHGCEALQIFTKNASRWRGRPLPMDEVKAFRQRLENARIQPAVSHASYLINLASAHCALREQSMIAMADELDRATSLGLLGVVLHPGCATSAGRERGIELVADALLELLPGRPHGRPMILLEQTAGQGTALGSRFEELAAIIDRTNGHARVGVCLDSCHLLAAGYDVATDEGYRETFDAFERVLGFDRLHVIHVNDSKRPRGSRVDRHEHLGKGFVGVDAFRRLVNDPRLAGLPMLLETPKAGGGKPTGVIQPDPFDTANLEILRGLLAGASRGSSQSGSRDVPTGRDADGAFP